MPMKTITLFKFPWQVGMAIYLILAKEIYVKVLSGSIENIPQ